jgi:hypothetical protein
MTRSDPDDLIGNPNIYFKSTFPHMGNKKGEVLIGAQRFIDRVWERERERDRGDKDTFIYGASESKKEGKKGYIHS